MSLVAQRQEFAPPPTAGLVRAVLLAIAAHGVLLAVLTAGVQWKHEATPVTVEAELWSAVPQQAASPAPEPEPQPAPQPESRPEPVVVAKPVPQPDPAIALAKEKAKLLKEKQLQQDRLEQVKLVSEKKALEKKKQEKELLAKTSSDKAAKDKTAKDNLAKQALQDAKADDERRQLQIKRMAGLAGTGTSANAGSTGAAALSSGPSTSYGGRIVARIKPNITFTDTINGNPVTEIEVSLSPTGDILSRRILKSSGNKAWDNAALNSIDKTEKLPLDNGKNWSPLTIVLSPQALLGQ